MGALRAAQFEYDNRMPPAVSEVADAESTWIDDGIAELMARRDVVFQRRMRPKQGVTYERFAQAVDEFVMGQLGLNGISNSVLGRRPGGALQSDQRCSSGSRRDPKRGQP